MASASKKVATSIAAFALAVTLAGCPRPSSDPASAAAATTASAVAERGRKLAEAVERVFADIYSASEATRSGADEAQPAQVERALGPYEKLAVRYGFQPVEPPEGGRSYFRDKYLLIVLDSGRGESPIARSIQTAAEN